MPSAGGKSVKPKATTKEAEGVSKAADKVRCKTKTTKEQLAGTLFLL